jgi:peptidoglycan/xylan/chitin deacetylase (PgdA/CDA1 family)
MMNKIAILIHFDSLGEVYRFPMQFKDPSFFQAMDRFLEFSNQDKFPYSIYFIGKDLRNKMHAEKVKQWSEMGHEIGNHSWSHREDLSLLPKTEVHRQISKTHEIIASITGIEPKGFAGPGWTHSSDIYNTLISLNYSYDVSVFPSWIFFLQYLFWTVNFIGTHKHKRFLLRGKDIIKSISSPSHPFIYYGNSAKKKLYILPLPVTRTRIICFHSMGYMFGWKMHNKIVQQALQNSESFYYVMHISDFLGTEDIRGRQAPRGMPRLSISIEKKRKNFERILEIFRKNDKKIVTAHDLAQSYFYRKTIKSNNKLISNK